MNSPRIIADQNMPFVETYFGHLGSKANGLGAILIVKPLKALKSY